MSSEKERTLNKYQLICILYVVCVFIFNINDTFLTKGYISELFARYIAKVVKYIKYV